VIAPLFQQLPKPRSTANPKIIFGLSVAPQLRFDPVS